MARKQYLKQRPRLDPFAKRGHFHRSTSTVLYGPLLPPVRAPLQASTYPNQRLQGDTMTMMAGVTHTVRVTEKDLLAPPDMPKWYDIEVDGEYAGDASQLDDGTYCAWIGPSNSTYLYPDYATFLRGVHALFA